MDDEEDSTGPAAEETEISAAESYIDWWLLWDRKLDPGSPELGREDDKRLWNLTATLLAQFADEVDGGRGQDPHVLLRADPFRLAAAAIVEATEGFLPRAWRSQGSGRKGRSPGGPKRVGVGYARGYFAAIEDGLITDTNPNKTVRDVYGVDETTVQKWSKKPLGLQSEAIKISLLRIGGDEKEKSQTRLATAKRLLARGARLYKMGAL